MTAVAERRTVSAQATLRTLAWVEARRFARHPLFLLGVVLLGVSTAAVSDDRNGGILDFTIAPAFLLGVLGMVVAHRLTRSMARPGDAVRAAPADGVLRTAALCLACLVPGVVAVAWVAWCYVAVALWPAPELVAISGGRQAVMLACGVVYAVGGALLGVLLGRWTRFPGAPLVMMAALYGWTLLGLYGQTMAASRLGNLVALNPPFVPSLATDNGHDHPELMGGSPGWYLVYIALLCGLAAAAAMVHEAVGARRTRLWRTVAVLGLLALTCLGLAAMGDPTRTTL
ncbi:MAG: hypothetical protein JWR45_2456 [Blastococcus sp.]|jgi:hypothetical protein|nr:hypothetical protein [Blastococcus sp.]